MAAGGSIPGTTKLKMKSIPNVDTQRLKDRLAVMHQSLHTVEGLRELDVPRRNLIEQGMITRAISKELVKRGENPSGCKYCDGDTSVHDLKKLFPHDEPQVISPWPPTGRLKRKPLYDAEKVREALRNPKLTEVDPKILKSTQGFVTRAGVEHYLKHDTLYGDQHVEANKYPVVYVRANGDHVILAGHHRAAAALVSGRPLRAVVVKE